MAELYLRCTCASEKAFVCNKAVRGGWALVHVRPFNITHAEAHLRNAACAYESIEPVRIISVAICLGLGGRPANMLVVSTPKRPGWTVLTRCSPKACPFGNIMILVTVIMRIVGNVAPPELTLRSCE